MPTVESKDVRSVIRPRDHWKFYFRSKIKKEEGQRERSYARVLDTFDHPSSMLVIWCQFFAIKWKTNGFGMREKPEGERSGRSAGYSVDITNREGWGETLFRESCLVKADSVTKFTCLLLQSRAISGTNQRSFNFTTLTLRKFTLTRVSILNRALNLTS